MCSLIHLYMSQFNIYLKVEPFIRQWLVNKYGAEPIKFDIASVENSTIRLFLQKQPKDSVPQTQQPDEVAICIPESKAKPTVTYNYLGPYGKNALRETIEDVFKRQLWNELYDLSQCGCSVLNAVRAWMEANGIDIEYDYVIKMRYQRLREAYLRNDIDLRKKTRTRSKEK